jgi:hypothetical protein
MREEEEAIALQRTSRGGFVKTAVRFTIESPRLSVTPHLSCAANSLDNVVVD